MRIVKAPKNPKYGTEYFFTHGDGSYLTLLPKGKFELEIRVDIKDPEKDLLPLSDVQRLMWKNKGDHWYKFSLWLFNEWDSARKNLVYIGEV